ncbi:BLUF domain-containing protein [Brevundimonas naejangsanensis]|uniref:BLUF domain-containing protein n=1 Tax=Brevundimonas naejangsanensis TaxID=588932 RepID=A0A494RL84_9CAUL|nr:BLUF domain-containing protein [Brevundimonas naejangsanensis]AYG94544.1 BLUF domain-containing protein [Brevundimonas naejangsanensis]
MPLHRAIFVSDAVGAAATSLLPLAEILGQAGRNNRRSGLTSALMRHDGRFLQVIEGRRADVDRLMDRLRLDPRHENVRLLSDVAVADRRFGDWPMILVELTSAAARVLNGEPLDQLSPARAETLLATAVDAAAVPA